MKLQQTDIFYKNIEEDIDEWLKNLMSSSETNKVLDGKFMRDSVELNLKIEEALAMLKNKTMVQDSPLNVTGQVKAYHDDVVEKQFAALKNKTPYEENSPTLCKGSRL